MASPRLSRFRRSYRFVLPRARRSRERTSFSISAPAPTSECLCCSLPCARQPNGNLSSQISTCGKAGSLNSRYMNNGRFIKARQMASGRTFRLGLQMADFILVRTSSLSARPRLGLRMPDFISPRISRACFIKAGQLQWPLCQPCGGPNGQISTFGLCVADFILSRIKNLSAARPSNFIKGSQSELQFYQRDGRFIKKLQNWSDLQIYATG